jgi:hypothetical protein
MPELWLTVAENALMILLFDLLSTGKRAGFMMIYNVSCELIAELFRRKVPGPDSRSITIEQWEKSFARNMASRD